jgi:hypothetical protein
MRNVKLNDHGSSELRATIDDQSIPHILAIEPEEDILIEEESLKSSKPKMKLSSLSLGDFLISREAFPLLDEDSEEEPEANNSLLCVHF